MTNPMPAHPSSILVFAGSTRAGSLNKLLARAAAAALTRHPVTVTYLDLRDYPLPLYDGDLEQAHGIPDHALRLKALFRSHHAFLIASPEYNSSFSAVLKNVIDWVSRPLPDEPPLAAFRGKLAALVAASPGARGGICGLRHLRELLENIHVTVLPEQVTLPRAHEAFSPTGDLTHAETRDALDRLASKLVARLAELSPSPTP